MTPIPVLSALGLYLAIVLSLIAVVLLCLAVIDRIVRWLRPAARIQQPEQLSERQRLTGLTEIHRVSSADVVPFLQAKRKHVTREDSAGSRRVRL